jgi:hypothetical protein
MGVPLGRGVGHDGGYGHIHRAVHQGPPEILRDGEFFYLGVYGLFNCTFRSGCSNSPRLPIPAGSSVVQ